METGEHLCLIWATSGNRKISTVVSDTGGTVVTYGVGVSGECR